MRGAAVFAISFLLAICSDANAVQENQTNSNSTNVTQKLFTYAGSLLPSDWSLVSILNDRAVIGFTNGSSRNALMEELEPKDRTFLQRLQNGTIYSTPLAKAQEKISQWSSSVTSTVSKFGKSVKEQLDQLINNKPKESTIGNTTIILYVGNYN